MQIAQVKTGEVYAWIQDYGSRRQAMSCSSSVEKTRPVRVLERVKVPQTSADKCGRTLVTNQTMFKVEQFDISPLSMYASDLDAACDSPEVKVNETLILAKDCLCPWDMEVERARTMASLKTKAQRYQDYLEGLSYYALLGLIRSEEVRCLRDASTAEGKIFRYPVSLEITDCLGDVATCLRMTDSEWVRHMERPEPYYIPDARFTATVSIYRERSAMRTPLDSETYYGGRSPEFSTSMTFYPDPITVFAREMKVKPAPIPKKRTKSGDITVAYKKWDNARRDTLSHLAKDVQNMPWGERARILALYVEQLAYDVQCALKARGVAGDLPTFDREKTWSEWRSEKLKALRAETFSMKLVKSNWIERVKK